MNDLQEILKFVTSEIKINPAVFKKMMFLQKDQKLGRLITFLQQQDEASDEDAIKTVYGNILKTGRYRVLKTRLKDRLLNLVFLSDNNLSFKNLYFKTVFRLNRNILAAKFLILKDKRNTGIQMLKPALKTALQFELTQEAIECCSLLCYHAAYTGNTEDLKYYQKINNLQQRILHNERKMEALYNSTLSCVTVTAGYDARSFQLLKTNFEKARVLFTRHSSYFIILNYHRIAMYYYHSRNQFSKVIRISNRFITYLRSHEHLYQDARYGEFALYIMESCMRLRDFEAAKKYAARCEEYYIPYSTPWLQFHEYYFLLAMRTGNIVEALKIHNTIAGSPVFYKLPSHQKERWRIHEAYLNFALPDELPKKQFRLFRFLNEVPVSNHDKPGYNFSILLAQIILLINIGDMNRLMDAEFAFKNYFRRYIKKEEHPRSFYFGSMIVQLFKNNFKFEKQDKNINTFLEKLKGRRNKLNPVEETEEIPYETLWEMLKKKMELMIEY